MAAPKRMRWSRSGSCNITAKVGETGKDAGTKKDAANAIKHA